MKLTHKSWKSELRYFVAKRLPPRTGRKLYIPNLALFKSVLQANFGNKVEVWIRNSFHTEAFRPFLSDLDLTIWVNTSLSRSESNRLYHLLRALVRISPFVNEVNLYKSEDQDVIRNLINPYELERDSGLMEKLGKKESEKDAATRSTFILRHLLADIKNLQATPALRVPKWKLHFEAVGIPFTPDRFQSMELAIDQIIRVITMELGEFQSGSMAERIREDLHTFLAAYDTPRPYPNFSGNLNLAILFPNMIFPERSLPCTLNHAQLKLYLSQMKWEVWGIYSQAHLYSTFDWLGTQIKRLKASLMWTSEKVSKEDLLSRMHASIHDGLRRIERLRKI